MFEIRNQAINAGQTYRGAIVASRFKILRAAATGSVWWGATSPAPAELNVKLLRQNKTLFNGLVYAGFEFSDVLGFDWFEITSPVVYADCFFEFSDVGQASGGETRYWENTRACTIAGTQYPIAAGGSQFLDMPAWCTKLLIEPLAAGIVMAHSSGGNGVALPANVITSLDYPESTSNPYLRNTTAGTVTVQVVAFLANEMPRFVK